jgi:hypothetical protein
MRQMRFAAPLLLGLAAATTPFMPQPARAQIAMDMSITIAPPILPVYEQPPIPGPGYIWVPGYWAWGLGGYYWVPGTWVLPPLIGLLWTPGYWGCGDDGLFVWHEGYWGPHVGFYGGVNYGFGYEGRGYDGGYWQHNQFFYNRTVNNFGGTHITNVYEHNVVNDITVNRISYNGGQGGIGLRPTPQELQFQNQRRFGPSDPQMQQEHMAANNHDLWATQNHGRPPIAATPRPADFTAHGVEPAHNAPEAIPAPHEPNVMTPQHPDQFAAPQHEPTPNVVEPERSMASPQHEMQGNMNRPEEHAPQPAYHPEQFQPLHEPQAYQPQMHAPEQRPPQPAYHPEQNFHPAPPPRPAQPEMHQPAYHPPAPHPEAPHPAPENHGNEQHRPGG